MSGNHKGIQKKKFKKSYYRNFKDSKSRKNALAPGCKGFLITCNAQEQYAVREAYNLLNEYADKLYGEQNKSEQDTCDPSSEKAIEDDLEEELRDLRQSEKPFRFNQRFTGVKNVIFVNSEIGDPCQIALSIMENIKDTKKQVSRFLLRLVPVLSVCKPSVPNLKEAILAALDDFLVNHFSYGDEQRNVTYAAQYHARNNNKALAKEEVYSTINEVMSSKGIAWKVNLENPDLTIGVDLLGTTCCISVLPDYLSFKKYNLAELAKVVSSNETKEGEIKTTELEETQTQSEGMENTEKSDETSDNTNDQGDDDK